MAGFPCTPFSTAGKREGVKDPRGQLYKECIRIIKAKKPKVVLFENVRGNKLIYHKVLEALERYKAKINPL